MCIIIDANVAHEFCVSTPDAALILRWLRQEGTTAVGGRLKGELFKVVAFRGIYQQLLLAGKLFQYADTTVNTEEKSVERSFDLASNDAHILALARVAAAQILFSRDKLLHKDFRNPKIVNPRGRVYQNTRHAKLLRGAHKCRTP